MLRSSETQDDVLVKGLCKGEEICFEKLFLKYSAAIFKICRVYKLEQVDSEEVVQEVFIKVWEHRSRLNPDFSFKAYLYTIAKNLILKHIRRHTVDFAFKEYLIATKPNSDNNTENQIYFNELQLFSDDMINQLSPQRKQVFILSKIEGLSLDEISHKLGLSKRTVEHHLYHAQKFIRDRFTGLKVSMLLLFMLFI